MNTTAIPSVDATPDEWKSYDERKRQALAHMMKLITDTCYTSGHVRWETTGLSARHGKVSTIWYINGNRVSRKVAYQFIMADLEF